MGLTLLGFMFLPVCAYCWRMPARLLELIFVGSVFSAAAAIVLGGFGVPPSLVPTALFIGFVVLKLIFGTRYPAERTVLVVLSPFIAVSALALISSVIMPRFFENEILVWPQKASSFFVITPLAPNSGNLTQDMYLAVCAGLTITASLYLTRSGMHLKRVINAYFISGLLVVAISLWQFAGNQFHIWFPTNFFLSNPGWALLSNESIGSFIRLSGPFSEPSGLAGYLAGSVGASGLVVLNGHKGLLPRLLLSFGGFVLLLSTSTTGYAALAIMIAMITVYTVLIGSAVLRKRLAAGFAGAAVFLLLCTVTIPAAAPGVANFVVTITTATLNKQQSSSFTNRSSTDKDSLNEALASDGLGVGWGSNRSNSLIPGLLAAIGIWGIAGLLWFAFNVIRHVNIAQRLAASDDQRMIMRAAAGGIIGVLTTAFISGPAINSPDFYLLLALLVATAARVRYEASAVRLPVQSQALVPINNPHTA